MFIIYIKNLSNKKNVKMGVYILPKIKNTDGWKYLGNS